jgi:glucan 1,3-beta-glucosidase
MSKPNPNIDSSPTRHAGRAKHVASGRGTRRCRHARGGSGQCGPGAAQTQTASQAQSHSQAQVLRSTAQRRWRPTLPPRLQRGVHGLCFSPYLQGQQPGSQISEEQIRERLQILKPYTGWVRSFSCTDGHEQTPRVARELGFKTLVGAWLGTDAQINERELQGVIDVARAGHADIVAVGNEVLLREDMPEDDAAGLHPARQGRRAGRARGLCRRLLPV